MVGQGFLEAVGRSGKIGVAWNETVFTKVDNRMGQFLVAVKFKGHSDKVKVVVI